MKITKYKNIIIAIAVAVACISCMENNNNILIQLENWMESSSPPENDRILSCYSFDQTIISPEQTAFEYYMVEDFIVTDSCLYVADGMSSMLLAFDSNGVLIWKSGGKGEGPGSFSGLGEIALQDSILYACNHAMGRVDCFDSATGEWKSSIHVQWPYEVIPSHNGNLYVVSLYEE